MAYHTLTWLAWLGAAAYVALVNQQPLHTLLLILAAGTVFTAADQRRPSGEGPPAASRHGVKASPGQNRMVEGWRTFLRFGLGIWLLALAFNALTSHAGSIMLFTLPGRWPLIGGAITLEAFFYGLASGASLFAMLLVFATFNVAADQHRILRWIPAGLFQAGLIVSIALTFVPHMVSSLQEIREAQRIRGHRFRGLRDLVPLFVPLITTALERSLTLAESMEARGFGGVPQKQALGPQSRTWSAMTLTGLLALLAGMIWQAVRPRTQWAGSALLGLGVVLVLLALYAQGRRVQRTHYRRELWRTRDTVVSLACLASALVVTYARMQNPQALSYYPYPPFSPWPRFTWLPGMAAVLVATPSFLWPSPNQMARAAGPTESRGGQA